MYSILRADQGINSSSLPTVEEHEASSTGLFRTSRAGKDPLLYQSIREPNPFGRAGFRASGRKTLELCRALNH
eukprot:scaffold634_cov401-Prasinococcus_capsulatus_cf.AAC.9